MEASIWPIPVLTTWTGPDGRTVLAIVHGDGWVQCYDADTGRPVGRPFIRTRRIGRRPRVTDVTALAAWTTSDGYNTLAYGGRDGMVYIWDADEGIMLASLSRHRLLRRTRSWLDHLSFRFTRLPLWRMRLEAVVALTGWTGPHGSAMASIYDDGTARCWDGDAGTPIGRPWVDPHILLKIGRSLAFGELRSTPS